MVAFLRIVLVYKSHQIRFGSYLMFVSLRFFPPRFALKDEEAILSTPVNWSLTLPNEYYSYEVWMRKQ